MTKSHRRQGWFLAFCGFFVGLLCLTAEETMPLAVIMLMMCSGVVGVIFGVYVADDMDDGKFL